MSKGPSDFIAALKKQKVKKNLLDTMEGLPRERFLDPVFAEDSYAMIPIPIGYGQTTDEPLVLARMLEALSPRKNWRVLEVGTGSGYSAAVLARMVDRVVTVEYHDELAARAKEVLGDLGYGNVKFYAGDATQEVEKLEEFDAMIIYAACRQTPLSLIGRLKNGGVMVLPLGMPHQQQITRYVNNLSAPDMLKNYRFMDFCSFSSIRGKYGWEDVQSPFVQTGEEDAVIGEGPAR
ncbi:MAG: protein-L-isoaspartate O-methyltransferase [Spirochaetes bacterium]|nr:protein-L-isoaspartate O-methyltransferase [Spirochaetota bacterium]